MVPKVIIQSFTRKGWEIGANEKHDFCPKCAQARIAERRARRIKTIAKPEEPQVPAVNGSHVTTIPPAISAEPPAEMGRTEKRIIFAQLQEVYEDETSGYKTPWTDAGVAKHLGVPQAWVAFVREENFGPAADNQEIRAMLERVKLAAGEAETILAEAKAIRNEGAGLVERINALAKQASEVGRALAGLTAIAERIERSVKA